jgi:hypothetical protein
MSSRARRLWRLLEPYHALTYFAPEARETFESVGLRGFWRGYFAGRAAPLGPVGPGPVVACFYGFHPDFVARALPSVWTMATPDQALEARLTGAEAASRRLFPEPEWESQFAEVSDLLRDAFEGCAVAGRPLFAANMDLDWPSQPHRALWHGATLLREYRGDGHVTALAGVGLDPCESHVTQIAASGAPPETIEPYRGWSTDDWQAASERLQSRGWLDSDGRLTAEGCAVRDRVEADTDRLASEPLERLGPPGFERLIDLATPVASRLANSGTIPYPNPIGVPDPR